MGCKKPRTKKKRPNPSKNAQRIRTLQWSGRLDLNQRPLAPQSDSARSAGLASGSIGAQALDIIGSVERADPSNGVGATPDQPGFVPPLSPRPLEPPPPLLPAPAHPH